LACKTIKNITSEKLYAFKSIFFNLKDLITGINIKYIKTDVPTTPKQASISRNTLVGTKPG
jgi:hypothetical protein